MRVLEGQSVFDIAVQTAGGVEAAFSLALANGVSLTDDLTAGQELATVTPANKPIAEYYANKNIMPATGLTAEEQQATLGGIGYMGIGIDFIVS
jgi:hypothetical protein